MKELILASESPRRKEILRKFDIPFKAVTSSLTEVFTDDPPEEQVKRLSREKIDVLLKERPDLSSFLILGADTCISFSGKIIGKPVDETDAVKMLMSFSEHTHRVITGLTLYNGRNYSYKQKTAVSEVTFAALSPEEIEWYISTEEWKGVAGGYRIQERGALLIESIKGSYYNIMGLPIRLFYGMLASQDSRFKLRKV